MAGEMVPMAGEMVPVAGTMGGMPAPGGSMPSPVIDAGTEPGPADLGMTGDGGVMPVEDAGMQPPDDRDASAPDEDAAMAEMDAEPAVIDAAPDQPDAMPMEDPDAAPPMPPLPPEECVALVGATQAFLDLLEPGKANLARAAYGGEHHRRFEFLPPQMAPRVGLSMRNMDDAEIAGLGDVLRAAMSVQGYERLEAIRNMELLLRATETPPGAPQNVVDDVAGNRDPLNYYIQIFGEPSVDGEQPWGLRFEGHHLSIQTATLACRVFSATPSFWGAGPDTTPLLPLIESADALWDSLAPALQAQARIVFPIPNAANAQLPGQDARNRSIVRQPAQGLAAAEMDAEQRRHLMGILAAYLGNMAEPIEADRFAAIEAAGIEAIHFGYNEGHYRVSGPTFLIEFVFHRNSRSHIHAAWRDYAGDFGDDLIARHLGADHGDEDPEMNDPDPEPDPPVPEDCSADCVDTAGACCGACLASNGVCYAETSMWCADFNYRWCGN